MTVEVGFHVPYNNFVSIFGKMEGMIHGTAEFIDD